MKLLAPCLKLPLKQQCAHLGPHANPVFVVAGFTTMSRSISPVKVMQTLNALFGEFDHLCDKWGVHKVETAGDW